MFKVPTCKSSVSSSRGYHLLPVFETILLCASLSDPFHFTLNITSILYVLSRYCCLLHHSWTLFPCIRENSGNLFSRSVSNHFLPVQNLQVKISRWNLTCWDWSFFLIRKFFFNMIRFTMIIIFFKRNKNWKMYLLKSLKIFEFELITGHLKKNVCKKEKQNSFNHSKK